eukprot:g6739.t1
MGVSVDTFWMCVILIALTACLCATSILRKDTSTPSISLFLAGTEILKWFCSLVLVLGLELCCKEKKKKTDDSNSCSKEKIKKTDDSNSWLMWLPPALMYALSNNMAIRALHYIDPVTSGMVIQVKIIFTAWLLRFGLKKKLSTTQWISIFLLLLGVLSSQITWISTSPSNDQDVLIVHHKNSKHSEHHHLSAGSRHLLTLIRDSQDLLGPLEMSSVTKIMDSSSDSSSGTEHHDDLTSSMETVVFGHFKIPKECWGVLLCCSSAFLVAFANVSCEWMYKRNLSRSIHYQNVRLYSFTALVSILIAIDLEWTNLSELTTMFSSLDMTIVFAVLFSAISGILTAAVMKFTNNLVFVFVNVVTTSLLLVLSHFRHELVLNTYQIGGMLLSFGSMCLYFLSSLVENSGSSSTSSDLADRRTNLQRHDHRFADSNSQARKQKVKKRRISSPTPWSFPQKRQSSSEWDESSSSSSEEKEEEKLPTSRLEQGLLNDALREGRFVPTRTGLRRRRDDEGSDSNDDENDDERSILEKKPLFRKDRVISTSSNEELWIESLRASLMLKQIDLDRLYELSIDRFEAHYEATETPEEILTRDALRRFYRTHNPKFVSSAEDVLMRHRGIEDILVKRLEQKYVDAKIPDILLRAAERAHERRRLRDSGDDVGDEKKSVDRLVLLTKRRVLIISVGHIEEDDEEEDKDIKEKMELKVEANFSLLDVHEIKYPEQNHHLVTIYFKHIQNTTSRQQLRRFTFHVNQSKEMIDKITKHVMGLRTQCSNDTSTGKGIIDHHSNMTLDTLGELKQKGTEILGSWMQKARDMAASRHRSFS